MEASVLRAELADWERQFKAENGRKPTTQDAPEDVRAKYLALARLLKLKTDSAVPAREVLDRAGSRSMPGAAQKEQAGALRAKASESVSTSAEQSKAVKSLSEGKTRTLVSTAPLRSAASSNVKPLIYAKEQSATDALKGLASLTTASSGISLISCTAPLTGSKGKVSLPTAYNEKQNEGTQENQKVSMSYYDWVEEESAESSDDGSSDDEENAPDNRSIEAMPLSLVSNKNRVGRDRPKLEDLKSNSEPASPDGQSVDNTKRPKLDHEESVSKMDQSSLFSGKSVPNFVRMNLKKDWKPRVSQGQHKSKKERHKKGITNHDDTRTSFDSSHEEALTSILDLLEGNGVRNDVDDIPRCGHDISCVELVVKKASTGNKGRVFYCCSLGRQASCGFFKWKDDTRAAAQKAFLSKKDEVDIPSWVTKASVSDLRATLRKLNQSVSSGKKSELLDRLRSAWVERSNKAQELQGSNLTKVAREVFFHQGFLDGQKEAIERVLNHQNSLVVRATGSGKSLIYQVAAFMLPGLTLVVSPLISLIQDQIAQLPPGLVGRAIIGTQKEQAEAIADAMNGVAKLLFVSPERIFSSSFQSLIRRLPKISLVCVDEAHCVSLWSHNFRPSYLRLGETLRKLVPEATVLALTATAALRIQREICQRLDIPFDQGGVHSTGSWIRPNLHLRIELAPASEDQRFAWLVNQLKTSIPTDEDIDQATKKLATKDTVPSIIYTSTKNETAVLAERLSAQGFAAAPYHSALEMSERVRNQNNFLKGKIRIIVATVAFGMGLNKPDIRRVIHYRLPGSIENYVQEIGRAGRDGEPAECICLLDPDAEEARRAHALSHSDGIEMKQLEMLINQVARLHPNEAKTLFIDEAVSALDIRESVIETLLVLLEAEGFIQLRATGFGRAKITFGARSPSDAFGRILRKMIPAGSSAYSLDVCQLAAECMRCGLGDLSVSAVNKCLFKAKDSGTLTSLQLVDRCFFLHRTEKPWDDSLCAQLKQQCDAIEKRSVGCIEAVHAAMTSGLRSSDEMLGYISRYLETDEHSKSQISSSVPFQTFDDIAKRAFSADVRSLWRDAAFLQVAEIVRSPRAIVRILLAIPSTSFPAETWRSHRLWGRYKQYRFEDLYTEASKLLS